MEGNKSNMSLTKTAFVLSSPVGRGRTTVRGREVCARRKVGAIDKKLEGKSALIRWTPRARAVEFDQNSVLAVLAAAAGVIGGIGLVAWTESQGERTEQRQNTQPCVECKGSTTTTCTVCAGTAKNPLDSSKPCSYCDGAGSIKCFNCSGSGIQPRYLDRYAYNHCMLSFFRVSTLSRSLTLGYHY